MIWPAAAARVHETRAKFWRAPLSHVARHLSPALWWRAGKSGDAAGEEGREALVSTGL